MDWPPETQVECELYGMYMADILYMYMYMHVQCGYETW